jgi:Na+-translocating ferredoxin:NAD+ oxidoreductase RnfE subunit
MKLATPKTCISISKSTAAFTLAEVLAALMFIAIVVPVIVAAIQISGRAGEFAARKSMAARVADTILNQNIVNTNLVFIGDQSGTETEGTMEFPWKLTVQTWPTDRMQIMTAEVKFSVQARDYSVKLSTLTTSPGQVSLNGVQP